MKSNLTNITVSILFYWNRLEPSRDLCVVSLKWWSHQFGSYWSLKLQIKTLLLYIEGYLTLLVSTLTSKKRWRTWRQKWCKSYVFWSSSFYSNLHAIAIRTVVVPSPKTFIYLSSINENLHIHIIFLQVIFLYPSWKLHFFRQ